MGETDPSPSADEDMAVLIARANEIGPQLDEATDTLNRGISAAENEIANLKLGVTASVPFPLSGDDADFERILAFGKMGDKWRFIVESGPKDDPDHWTATPLLNASKEVRLEAVDLFEELLAAVILKAAEQRQQIMVKANQALKFAVSVGRAEVYASTTSGPTGSPKK